MSKSNVNVEVRIARDTPSMKAVDVRNQLKGLPLKSVELPIDDRPSGGIIALIRATPGTPHDVIVKVIERLQTAGVDKVTLGRSRQVGK